MTLEKKIWFEGEQYNVRSNLVDWFEITQDDVTILTDGTEVDQEMIVYASDHLIVEQSEKERAIAILEAAFG